MKKTRLFLILFFVALLMFLFAGKDILSVVQIELGGIYHVSKHYSEAAKWYRRASDRGYAPAQYNLGQMYYKGQGVSQNYAEAAKWYRKGAEQGDAKSQYNLGHMFRTGQGVPQDYAETEKWFRKAAEQGDAFAQFNLGLMYARGDGVPQEYKTAYIWFSLAVANFSGENREKAADFRDRAAKMLSAAALEQAQQIVRNWKPKKE